MNNIDELSQKWLQAKQLEQAAINDRRQIEDELIALMQIDGSEEGTKSAKTNDFSIKATVRVNRTVDADLVQELAAEAGVSEYLGDLFRWKPSINMSAWKATDINITNALLPAITSKPGRPTFTINFLENK